jgi:hypothetical protein
VLPTNAASPYQTSVVAFLRAAIDLKHGCVEDFKRGRMSIMQDTIDFVASYETWAKALIVGGLLIAIVTAIFAQRNSPSRFPKDEVHPKAYWLTISSPQLGSDVEYRFRVSGTIGEEASHRYFEEALRPLASIRFVIIRRRRAG